MHLNALNPITSILKKTATELHIDPNTLRYWQEKIGAEVFTKTADAHLARQAVNIDKRVEVAKLETNVKIEMAKLLVPFD